MLDWRSDTKTGLTKGKLIHNAIPLVCTLRNFRAR